MADPTPPEGIETGVADVAQSRPNPGSTVETSAPEKGDQERPTVSQWVEPEGMVACEWGPVQMDWSYNRALSRLVGWVIVDGEEEPVYRPCDAEGNFV